MARVRIGLAEPNRKSLDVEIAHLRGLDAAGLRARWCTVFGRPAPVHLPRHLMFRILAYRVQADRIGDLDGELVRLLDRSPSLATVIALGSAFDATSTRQISDLRVVEAAPIATTDLFEALTPFQLRDRHIVIIAAVHQA